MPGWLIIVLFFIVTISIHELGHFVVMRRNGIKVIELSVGFGPCLFKHVASSGIQYSLRLLPLGCYVKAAEGSFESARPWVRTKVALAGPLANIFLGSLALIAMFCCGGTSLLLNHPSIAWLPMVLRVPIFSFGVTAGLSFATPFLFVYVLATEFMNSLSGMAGPIGMVLMGNNMMSHTHTTVGAVIMALQLLWLLNVGIAGFNLMPLYPLDGGHCIDALLEKVGGRYYNLLTRWFVYFTLPILIVTMILVFISDGLRLTGYF